jgi:hypothetical protein
MAFPEVTNRVITPANRIHLDAVEGLDGTYDVTQIGTVSVAGTPINAELFALIEAAVVLQDGAADIASLICEDISQTDTGTAVLGDVTADTLAVSGLSALGSTTTSGLVNTGSSALGTATVTELNNLDDTGWVALSALLQTGWSEPYPLTDPVKIRKWGNFVQLKGVVVGTSGAGITILTLPSEYSPQDGSDHNAWAVANSAGNVTLVEGKSDGKINFYKGNQATGENSLSHMWIVG